MRTELKNHIKEENHYRNLLESNSQYRLQGRDLISHKVVVGVIQGNPKEYKITDHLNFKYFDTWKEAYIHLTR